MSRLVVVALVAIIAVLLLVTFVPRPADRSPADEVGVAGTGEGSRRLTLPDASHAARTSQPRLGTSSAASATEPSVADALRVLRTFDWSIAEAAEHAGIVGPREGSILLDHLLTKSIDDGDPADVRSLLGCLEYSGLPAGDAERRFAQWAGADDRAVFARQSARILARGSDEGRHLAVALARTWLERAQEAPTDRARELFARQALGVLAEERVGEAFPLFRERFDVAVERSVGLVGALQEEVRRRASGGASTSTPKSIQDPVRARQEARRYAEWAMAVDDDAAAAWTRDVLDVDAVEAPEWSVVVEALPAVLTDRPDGRLASAVVTWALERIDGLRGDEPHAAAVYLGAAGGGAKAVPALRRAVAESRSPIVREHAALALARAAATAPTDEDVEALWQFVDQRARRRVDDVAGPSESAERAGWSFVLEHGGEGIRERVAARVLDAPPRVAMRLLAEMPPEVWRGREAELIALVERLEPEIDRDAEAELTAELALTRIDQVAVPGTDWIGSIGSGRSTRLTERIADSARARRWRAAVDTGSKLACLRDEFVEGVHPFRPCGPEPSPFDRAVRIAREVSGDDVALVHGSIARNNEPLGLRVALARGRVLVGDDGAALAEGLESIVPAAAREVLRQAEWAAMHQLGHFKSVALAAVAHPALRPAARACAEAEWRSGKAEDSPLGRRLPVLVAYLDALDASGWQRLDLGLVAADDESQERFEAERPALAEEYLRHAAVTRGIALVHRARAVAELARRSDRDAARRLAVQLERDLSTTSGADREERWGSLLARWQDDVAILVALVREEDVR